MKNGYPWSAYKDLNIEISPELMNKAISLFEKTEWENLLRNADETAIYPHTRTLGYFPEHKNHHLELKSLIDDFVLEIGRNDLKVLYAEMTLLKPFGFIDWHFDRKHRHFLGTRIMCPITENPNTLYFFSSWSPNAPTDRLFLAKNFLGDDITATTLTKGRCYMFNHRVPHRTNNISDKIRGMVVIDLVDKNIELSKLGENHYLEQKELKRLEKPL